jgi:hypothetical protein
MSSSPNSFHNSFDSHEPRQELDSPFLNEEYLVEEARTAQTWRTPVPGFQLESPFLEAFEEGWGASEVEDFEEFLDGSDEEELEEEFEAEEVREELEYDQMLPQPDQGEEEELYEFDRHELESAFLDKQPPIPSSEESIEAEEEDLEERLIPASAIEFVDLAEWASVTYFSEPPITSGTARQTNAVLDSSAFDARSMDVTRLSLMRPVQSTQSGSPNYEFNLKSRVYYPRGRRRGQLAGTKVYSVVVIVHGTHFPFTNNTGAVELANHLGYEYLQRNLARHGIVSMSISVNAVTMLGFSIRAAAEFIKANLRLLEQLNTPNGHATEHRFENRLDLKSIGLVGQSRGGEAVVEAVVLLRSNANFKVKAVCLIAPTDVTGIARPQDQLSLNNDGDLRYLVLYGSHDGDISGADHLGVDPRVTPHSVGTGFRQYDRATCDRTMVFVQGITHNRFNTKWNLEKHYGDLGHCFVEPCSRPFDTSIRKAADHRQLAIDYVGGLFRLALNGETSRLRLFQGIIVPTGKHNVSIQWSLGGVPVTQK